MKLCQNSYFHFMLCKVKDIFQSWDTDWKLIFLFQVVNKNNTQKMNYTIFKIIKDVSLLIGQAELTLSLQAKCRLKEERNHLVTELKHSVI